MQTKDSVVFITSQTDRRETHELSLFYELSKKTASDIDYPNWLIPAVVEVVRQSKVVDSPSWLENPLSSSNCTRAAMTLKVKV